jgi:hypothetical protein
MAAGTRDSVCQTIAVTAPFSPRKPGNKACQNGAKATDLSCIHWVYLQSVPFTRERSQVQSLQRPPPFAATSAFTRVFGATISAFTRVFDAAISAFTRVFDALWQLWLASQFPTLMRSSGGCPS